MNHGRWLWVVGTLVGETSRLRYFPDGHLERVAGFWVAVNRLAKRAGSKPLPVARQMVFLTMTNELLLPRDRAQTEEATEEAATKQLVVASSGPALQPLQYSDQVTVHGWLERQWLVVPPDLRATKKLSQATMAQRQAVHTAFALWVQQYQRPTRQWAVVAKTLSRLSQRYVAGELSLAAFISRSERVVAARIPKTSKKFAALATKLVGIAATYSPERLGLVVPVLTMTAYKHVAASGRYGEPRWPQADYDPEQAADPAYQEAMLDAFRRSQLFRNDQGLPLNFGSQGYYQEANRWTQAAVAAWLDAH
ncbi:hypothetical protein [Lacticaseibacillus sp. GG6-2]